jgi:transcriptional regulator with XRE-family HTH domain
MEPDPPDLGRKRFGQSLRRWRERRHLSLDDVAAKATTWSEPIGRSSLARFESGEVLPTLDRLSVLARALDVPFVELVERYEVERRVAATLPSLEATPDDALLRTSSERLRAGRWFEALALVSLAQDRLAGRSDPERPERSKHLKLREIEALVHLGYHGLAKAEVEILLGDRQLALEEQIQAWQLFTMACYRLKRFTVALVGLDRVDALLNTEGAPSALRSTMAYLRGALQAIMGNADVAIPSYEAAIRGFDQEGDAFQSCSARVSLAEAQLSAGHLGKAKFEVEAAVEVARVRGFDRQRALGLSTLASISHRARKHSDAERYAVESNAIAVLIEYWDVCFRNNWILREIARAGGDTKLAERCERAMRAFLPRVDPDLPEAARFRSELTGIDGKGGSV